MTGYLKKTDTGILYFYYTISLAALDPYDKGSSYTYITSPNYEWLLQLVM